MNQRFFALAVAGLFAVLTGAARADVTLPCTGIAGGNVHAIGGPPATVGTYCVSDWGSSDVWYPTAGPPFYDILFDAFSGDDAANLRFSINGVLRSGTGWLPPILDAGLRGPSYNTNSAWLVDLGLGPSGGDPQTSLISNGNVLVTITTGVTGFTGDEIYQDYTIKNDGGSALQNVRFADYFNYHPNGSSNGGYLLGTATYDGLAGIFIKGDVANPNFLKTGQMCFTVVGSTDCSLLSSAHDIGDAQIGVAFAADPIRHVEDNAYNGVDGPFGPGDVAGSLAYDFGDIAPGDQVQIRVLKGGVLPVQESPEPGTLVLLACGVGLLACRAGLRARM
jgi:hypothetical protein